MGIVGLSAGPALAEPVTSAINIQALSNGGDPGTLPDGVQWNVNIGTVHPQ